VDDQWTIVTRRASARGGALLPAFRPNSLALGRGIHVSGHLVRYSVSVNGRITARLAVCAGLVCAASACADRKEPPAPPATTQHQTSQEGSRPADQISPRATTAGSEFAKGVLDELTNLQTAESLADWKKRHAGDSVELYAPMRSESGNAQWCARSSVEKTVDSARTSRMIAYFYVPEPPTPLALPIGVSPAALVDQCRLGLLWAQVDDADSARSEALAAAVRETTASTLGQGQVDARLWFGSPDWRKTGLWKRDGVSVMTAAADAYTRPSDNTVLPAHALVAAVGPASGLRFDPLRPNEGQAAYLAARQERAIRVDEARRIAALTEDVDSAVRSAQKLLADADGWARNPKSEEQTTMYEGIDRWLTASRSLPPSRRSAALFVADQLIELADGPFWERDQAPPVVSRLEAQGAKFVWLELGGNIYTHTWLKEARRLDPDGRAGELAFLTLMETGFETSGTCSDQQGQGFRAVIREGEARLRRNPSSPVNPAIHLLLAEAYADIVTLANGGGYDADTERAKFGPEAAGARTKSLEHFAAALASGSTDSSLRAAWSEGWRLSAGLPPTGTHFFCVYD
jgi:hypothetical protein